MSVRHANFKLRSKQRSPEAEIQRRCTAMLRAYMPAEVWWTASLSGVPLSPRLASEAKRAGLQKGAPDFSFIFPDGRTKYAELKAPGGTLTPEQARLQAVLGESRFQVCRSWPELRAVLEGWLRAYGLRLLTDRESVQREGQRRQAGFAGQVLKARPLRKRQPEHVGG